MRERTSHYDISF